MLKINPNLSLVLIIFALMTIVFCENSTCSSDCCKSLSHREAMTYTFFQDTGRFKGGSGAWAIDTKTYSGKGSGYLNPRMQCIKNLGPLPATTYKLAYCVNIMHQTKKRPCSFYLEPQKPK